MICIQIMSNSFEQTREKVRTLEQDNKNIKDRVMHLDIGLSSDIPEIQQLVIRQAYNMAQLIDMFPDLYPWKKESIFNAIWNDYQKSGASKHTLKQIYDAFRYPEYDVYKTNLYNSKKRRMDVVAEENCLAEKHAIDSQVFENIYFIENHIDNPTIQNFIQRMAKDHIKHESRIRKEKEDEDKITIPRPDWLPPNVQGQDSHLYRAIIKHIETWQDIAIRVFQYPPQIEKDDLWYAEGIETMTSLLVPGTDLKYVRDTLSYFDISYEKNTQSIHSAMSKSKILTPSGKWRKVTREQIADIDPQIILLAIHVIEKIPGLMHFLIYLMNEQKPYSGEFHLNRHDKLSESAFGKGSFVDYEPK